MSFPHSIDERGTYNYVTSQYSWYAEPRHDGPTVVITVGFEIYVFNDTRITIWGCGDIERCQESGSWHDKKMIRL